METSSLMWLQSPHRASEQPRTQQCLLRKSSQRQVRHIRPQHPLASLSESASAQLPLPPPAVHLWAGPAVSSGQRLSFLQACRPGSELLHSCDSG